MDVRWKILEVTRMGAYVHPASFCHILYTFLDAGPFCGPTEKGLEWMSLRQSHGM